MLRAIISGVILLGGIGAVVYAVRELSGPVLGVGAFAVLLGVLGMAPVFAPAVLGTLALSLNGIRPVGRLARGNVVRNPRRTSAVPLLNASACISDAFQRLDREFLEKLERLTIRWPSGVEQTLENLAVDRRHTIHEPADGARAQPRIGADARVLAHRARAPQRRAGHDPRGEDHV